MIKVEVNPGVCGMNTTIQAVCEDKMSAVISVETKCEFIENMAKELDEISVFAECLGQYGSGVVFDAARKHCKHPTCPVPTAILKAVEAACGLALPKDVEIKITKE